MHIADELFLFQTMSFGKDHTIAFLLIFIHYILNNKTGILELLIDGINSKRLSFDRFIQLHNTDQILNILQNALIVQVTILDVGYRCPKHGCEIVDGEIF